MYEYVCGSVASRSAGAVVVDVGGVGYRLVVSDLTAQRVEPGREHKLFTHQVLRDDRHELYGFWDESERYLFRQLLLVSGVGPAVAIALLSAYEPGTLAAQIAAGDLATLTRIKGVGKRTGERILVELRDRFQKAGGAPAAATPSFGGNLAVAVQALCSLGLPRAEAERRVASVKEAGLAVEDLVKVALTATP